MRQLYKPKGFIEVHLKTGEIITKRIYYKVCYGELPQDKSEYYDNVNLFMDKYSPHYLQWEMVFFERNRYKKITLCNGDYNTIKVCDINYMTFNKTHDTKLHSTTLKALCNELNSDEFLQYLYDKEKEFKTSDILESVK